ncbi:DUF4440 domain-containing protein [Saccharopolyspora sp. NPDC050389]|uniref:DUF4440 domain-containing protein n=1 Tax=Saccharopolyspora sp. NPDC050389 TaxID=3155516 RepID=UPI003410CB2F
MARARLVSADLAAEVERVHRLLAEWLGTDCGPAVLEALRAAHTDDFTMITTDGRPMTVEDLFGALAGARNAAPGLTIEVDEITTAADAADLAVVHFRETHHHEGRTTRRRTTAVLRRTGQGLRWHHLHETAEAD